MKKPWHLYEGVISNSRVWLKVQVSCWSTEHAAGFFEYRFTEADYAPIGGRRPVTPFRLSKRSNYITNWASIVDRLPAGWDDDNFHIEVSPYEWCGSLSDDCDCHGRKGVLRLCCSDFGLHEETDKRARKTQNVMYQNYIRELEDQIARRDESRRQDRLQRERNSPSRTISVEAKPSERGVDQGAVASAMANALKAVNRLVPKGFYCSIHGRHHPYGQQAVLKTVSSITGAIVQMPTWAEAYREKGTSIIGQLAECLLQSYESEECAQRSLWGDVEIPDILYKYIPKKRIGKGAPESLRATQLRALNDTMECNAVIRRGGEQEDTLAFLHKVKSKLEGHLEIEVQWEDLLRQAIFYGDLRLSPFIQEYLNPLVGVVSFSTDVLVPTMWAHYARNTGIVVGYETEALRALGFELRPVVYSELAPSYLPSEGDAIRLDFVDRERMERELRAGRNEDGISLLTRTDLAEFGAGWKSLSRLLLVKGISWAYEKEVRLLVDLKQTRDIGKKDSNCLPIKVIDPPREAIKEVYKGMNTQDADVELAVHLARGEKKSGIFVGGVSAHAFRMQKAGGANY